MNVDHENGFISMIIRHAKFKYVLLNLMFSQLLRAVKFVGKLFQTIFAECISLFVIN